MNQSPDYQEAKLIQELKAGSNEAFDQIYKLYSRRLYGFCLRFTKSSTAAQDIVQDVFMRLWIHRAKVINQESLAPLLFTIARNRMIKEYKAVLYAPSYEYYVHYCDKLSFSERTTDQVVEYEDFSKLILQAIGKLTPAQQKVVHYSKYKHLSNRQVAELLGVSEQTVKNHLYVALKFLRKELASVLFSIFLLGLIVLF